MFRTFSTGLSVLVFLATIGSTVFGQGSQPGISRRTVIVKVTPGTATVVVGGTVQLAAEVSGTTNTGVTWSVTPAVGTISASGLYAAPASLNTQTQVTVTARSVFDTTKTATANVVVNPVVGLTVTPGTSTVRAGKSQQFSASLSGTANQSVVWAIASGAGTVSSGGLYTAPAVVTAQSTAVVRATSAADASKSATVSVALLPEIAVSVTPSAAEVSAGGSAEFAATVQGTTNQTVVWTVSPAVGTITSKGRYAAPASVAARTAVTVRATSLEDGTKSASAVVTVNPVVPVSVSVTPATATVAAGGTVQLSSSVSGTANTGVTWSASLGSVSASGLYTAPASVSASTAVTVRATSVADGTKSASATVTVNPAPVVSVTVTPSTATVTAGGTVQLSSSVTGAANTAVTWSATVGSVSASGLYTAPASVAAATAVTVRATSVADGTKSASATVTVKPAVPVSVSVTPATASVTAGGTVQIMAVVIGSADTGVTWELTPSVGTLSTNGSSAVYTAPSVIQQNQVVAIKATSVTDTSKTATLVVTLLATVAVSVSPGTAQIPTGGTKQFTATVLGTTNTAVTWSLNPAIGSISAAGLYSAPAALQQKTAVTITAKSAADQAKSARAIVNVDPPAETPKVTFAIDSSRLTALAYGGTNFYSNSALDFTVTGVVFRSPEGVETSLGQIHPNGAIRTKTSSPESYEQIYRNGQPRQFTFKTVWTTPTDDTLRVDVYVTNQDQVEDLARISFRLWSLQLPSRASEYRNGFPLVIDQYTGRPVEALTGAWGSVAFWQSGYPTSSRFGTGYGAVDQTTFPFGFNNYLLRSGPSGTTSYEDVIKPGQTKQLTYYLRFSLDAQPVTTLAPDAVESFREEQPQVTRWTDKRPIGSWFISEGTKRSAKNPRGYLWEPSLDALDPNTFRTAVLARTDDVIRRLNALNPRPQGLIIWDLEGQEFNHSFTYVGAPNRLSDLAPEMNNVADEMFARLRSAGYQVGLTIRPQTFLSGPILPPACSSNSNYSLTDKFILTTATPPNRGYVCSATNTWTLAGPSGPYDQTSIDKDNEILELLSDKVRHAHSRWDVRLFYVDSNVWPTGSTIFSTLFRKLVERFPDCLFFPEWEDPVHYFGVGAPYNRVTMGVASTGKTTKQYYPAAFSLIDTAGGDMVKNRQALVDGVRGGDILLFPSWYDAIEIPVIQSIYQEAMQPKE